MKGRRHEAGANGGRGRRGWIHERKKRDNSNLQSHVHPQNTSRDACGLFERLIGLQPRMWAWRETQHAARDERSETKHKRRKTAKLSEQRETRGELERNRRHGTRERTQNMKETKEKGRETSCNVRPQRTEVWPRHSRIMAEGDCGPFQDQNTRERNLNSRGIQRAAARIETRGNMSWAYEIA
jgi:hypothetical protein